MQRRVQIAELRPECRQEYIEAHKAVWPELLARYNEIGCSKITCHLHGNTLIVVTEAEDLDAVTAALAIDEIDARWQAWMATLRPAHNPFTHAENVFEVVF